MTYTIIGRCPRTRQLGIGITTFSLAVGGYCPYIKADLGAVSSQASADPRLGLMAVRLLERGLPVAEVVDTLRSHDPYFEYRQVGVMDKDGLAAVHTGAKTLSWTGHAIGDGYAAMGNNLDSEKVVEAIARTFQETIDLDLDNRLLMSLESGRDAGGQQAAYPDWPNQDRSAALIVFEREEYALMDLRVDSHVAAIRELRRLRDEYIPYVPWYYKLRVEQPDRAPRHPKFLQQLKEV
jgi:uncharacterized Ntn-hydrolase superfamily protein